MQYNGTNYYYMYNVQGDVIALYDNNGDIVCRYTYDSWGKLISVKDNAGAAITSSTHIANVNPIRYRGYYYDTETGLYYLQSRYYNPEWGRFINADDVSIFEHDQDTNILHNNIFTYCYNNPVNMEDPGGEIAVSRIVGGVVGAGLGVLLAKQLKLTGWRRTALIAAAAVGGAALGAALGPYIAKLGSSVATKLGVKTAAKQVAKRTFSQLLRDITKNPKNWKMTKEIISKSTNIRNKGGLSIERIYKCKKTGELIYEHILKDKFGRIIDKHFRPYGK